METHISMKIVEFADECTYFHQSYLNYSEFSVFLDIGVAEMGEP